MKLHLALSAIVIPSVVGFQQLTSQHVAIRPVGKSTTTSVMAINEETDGEAVNQRRSLIKGGVLALAGISSQVLLNPGVANAGLLDDYGTDPSKIQQKEEPKKKEVFQYAPKQESDMEPNLRSNYYYPT